MNIQSLDQAIQDFNKWNRSAFIYYNQEENYFNTEVFADDVQMAGVVLSNGNFIVFRKNERENKQIGKIRKQYIVDYVKLVLEGYEPFQAEYKLSERLV